MSDKGIFNKMDVGKAPEIGKAPSMHAKGNDMLDIPHSPRLAHKTSMKAPKLDD